MQALFRLQQQGTDSSWGVIDMEMTMTDEQALQILDLFHDWATEDDQRAGVRTAQAAVRGVLPRLGYGSTAT